MNCNDIHVIINNFFDGSLTDTEKVEFEKHIESCEKCRLEFEEIKFIHEIMADSELSSLPENFEEELKEKLESLSVKSKTIDFNSFRESKSARYIKRNKKMLTSLAALLMIGVFTVGSMDNVSNYKYKAYDEAAVEEVSDSRKVGVMNTMADTPPIESDEALVFGKDKSSQKLGFGSADTNYTMSKASDELTNEEPTNDDLTSDINYKEDRLIIKNGYASVEVLDFDKTMEDIKTFVNSIGGYVSDLSSSDYGTYNESKDRYLKSGYINVRIPKKSFDAMFSEISTYGNTQSTSIRTNDVTDSYRSTSDEIINLQVREKKLREIMDKAVEIKDVIEVERELSRVRGEINRLEGNLQNWESLVELSSVNIEIREVKTLNKYIKPVDASLFEQAKYALVESLNNLMFFAERLIVAFIGNIPNFILIGLLALVFRIIYKNRKK